MQTADGRYDHTHPWVPQVNARAAGPRYQFLGPFASNEERLTQQAIQANILPGAEVAALVRVPLPQINPFPDRFGYATHVPGIMDVIDVSREHRDPRVSWFSGGVAGYSGASRNAMGAV